MIEFVDDCLQRLHYPLQLLPQVGDLILDLVNRSQKWFDLLLKRTFNIVQLLDDRLKRCVQSLDPLVRGIRCFVEVSLKILLEVALWPAADALVGSL